MCVCPGYDIKLHPVTKVQFSTIEVFVAMPMTRWKLSIVPCRAGGLQETITGAARDILYLRIDYLIIQ